MEFLTESNAKAGAGIEARTGCDELVASAPAHRAAPLSWPLEGDQRAIRKAADIDVGVQDGACPGVG